MRRLLCVALLAAGCGGPYRPASVRATAVAVGAFGAGAAVAVQACSTAPWDDCRAVALTGITMAGFAALAAGAVAFLEEYDEVPSTRFEPALVEP